MKKLCKRKLQRSLADHNNRRDYFFQEHVEYKIKGPNPIVVGQGPPHQVRQNESKYRLVTDTRSANVALARKA